MSKPPAEGSQDSGEYLSPAGLQDLAAMNARTYAMTEEDRKRWFKEHPVEMFKERGSD